jgi:hypothetical protein
MFYHYHFEFAERPGHENMESTDPKKNASSAPKYYTDYKLIGLVGKSGSGKDKFFSQVLAPLGYTRLSLADAVRVFSILLFTRVYEDINKDTASLIRVFPYLYHEMFSMNKSPLARTIQQYVGTELVKRKFDRDYWIKVLDPLVRERVEKGIKVAITDIRFPEEAEYVRKNGGLLIKMTGSSRYSEGEPVADHDSEKLIDQIEYHITDDKFFELLKTTEAKRKGDVSGK